MPVAADDSDQRTVAVRFILDAEPSPGLLSRLLQPFAKRDLVPDRVWAYRSATDLHVEIAMEAMPSDIVHLVEGNLRQVIGIRQLSQRCPTRLRHVA